MLREDAPLLAQKFARLLFCAGFQAKYRKCIIWSREFRGNHEEATRLCSCLRLSQGSRQMTCGSDDSMDQSLSKLRRATEALKEHRDKKSIEK